MDKYFANCWMRLGVELGAPGPRSAMEPSDSPDLSRSWGYCEFHFSHLSRGGPHGMTSVTPLGLDCPGISVYSLQSEKVSLDLSGETFQSAVPRKFHLNEGLSA